MTTLRATGASAPAPPSDPLDRRSGLRFTAYKWTLALAAAGVQSLVYFGIGRASINRSQDLLRTALDDAIPFWPWTAWFYLPFYAGIFIICVTAIRSRLIFHRALAAIVVIMLLGATGHLMVGAEYPRPRLAPPYADASAAFLAWVQRVDPPGNVFPSLHVAHSSALAGILGWDRPRLGALAFSMAVVLALSTLTTKQHFIADVIAGLAIGLAARFLVLRRLPRR